MGDAQVATWLRSAGLSRFAARFAAAAVATPRFLDLAPRELDALGVESPADRKRLADLIAEQRRARAMPPLESPPAAAGGGGGGAGGGAGGGCGGVRRSATLAPDGRGAREAREGSAEKEREEKVMPAVRVCVRKRPLSRKDVAAGERDIISTAVGEGLLVHEVKTRLDLTKYVDSHPFTFDRVFSDAHDNAEVYAGTARPLVDALFAGWRSTCFAYGQTGTGKTYTMEGTPGNPGLYLLSVRDVFRRAREDGALRVWISFFEIYGARLHDLLNGRATVQCREDAANEVRIQGLTERRCSTPDHVLALIERAAAARSTGVTGANDDSSRSHAVFQIELRRRRDGPALEVGGVDAFGVGGAEEEDVDDEVGRLSFIDLAGSERGSDTSSATVQTRREGAEINKSLLALKECIRAMDQGNHHTPFRGSKLTQVLKASFVGRAKCRTVMIANVSPASPNVEHTLNTLRYSQRVKEMKSSSPERDGADGFAYGVPRTRAGTSRSIAGTRSAQATPIGSPELVSIKADAALVERELMPLRTATPTPAGRAFSRTTSVGTSGFERRHTLVGRAAGGGSGRLDKADATERRSGGPGSGASGGRVGVAFVGDGDRDRAAADAHRPGAVRRRIPGSKSMIPTSTRSRRATMLGVAPSGDVDDALKHARRGRARESLAPASDVENGVGRDNAIGDDARHERLRRMTSGPAVLTVDSDDDSRGGGGAGAGVYHTGDTRARRPLSSSSGGDEFDADDVVDDDGDLLYAPPRPRTPPPTSAALVAGGIRTRRMVVPASARRRRADAHDAADGAAPLGAEAVRVVALHREKVAELTALMREGVELMHAVEAGRVGAGAYATRLEVNLALSMEIVHTLKMQVATLGAQER